MATILVVDDRPIERNTLRAILQYAGHRLLEANDGAEALQLLKDDPPDLVIADILMPTMDGYDFVSRLRDDPMTASIPVIFYTPSYLEREAKVLAEQSGISEILLKPNEPEGVFQAVSRALNIPPPSIDALPVELSREEHLQLLIAKAARQGERLNMLAPRLAALVELGQQLAAERDPMTLLRIFCDTARDITGAKYAAVAILDESGKTIQQILTSGMSTEESAKIGPLPSTQTLLHHLLLGGHEPVRIEDLTSDQRSPGFPANHPPMRSFLGSLLTTATRHYGSVYVTEKLGGMPFDDEDKQIIATLALQVSIAYENARRYEEVQREIAERKQAQEELVALYNATSYLFKSDSLLNLSYQIVQAVVHEFKKSDCGIILVDRKQNRLIRLARSGVYDVRADVPLMLDSRGLVPEAARTGKLIYAPDVTLDPRYVANVALTRSELVVPLQTVNGVVGVLDLQSEALNAFSEQDMRIVTAFAERAANAVQILHLYEELNLHAAELEARVIQRTDELHRAKEHVEAILNNTSDAVIVLGQDAYAIQRVNPAFSALFGYQPSETLNHPLSQFFVAEELSKLVETLSSVVDGRVMRRVELLGQHQNGSEVRVEIGLSAVRDERGQIANIVCTMSDITERKRAEAELRRALQKEKDLNELKTRFVSVVSHEFRTPLAVIMSSSELMKFYYQQLTDEKRAKHLEKIETQVKHLTEMLDEVMALNQAEMAPLAFDPTPVNLEEFCRDIIEELRQTAQATHQIRFSSEGECVAVPVDGKLMRQVVTNLLINAVKYSPGGGNIFVDLRCASGEAVIRVKDEGVGIPKEDHERLFEAFFRAKNVGTISGTGLGLSITKQAVEMHGGTISFESALGVGTTFTISIPIAADIQSY